MKKVINKKNLISLIMILYTFSIVLDLHVFYNSVSTLIRTIIITILFGIIFIKYSNKKERKLLIMYFILLGVFVIAHLINAGGFTNKVQVVYSGLSEILYFYKMVINIFLFYIIYKLNINYKELIKVIKICLVFICSSIVICNIFKIGYTSYGFETIEYNIFDWFKTMPIDFNTSSSKGYFHLANQIIAVILLYLPLLFNEIKENFKLSNILLSVITLLSMLMMGNRLSTAGPLIILVVVFLSYLFLILIKKESINIKYLIYLLSSIIIYNIFLFNSPLLSRENFYDDLVNNKVAEPANSSNYENEEIDYQTDLIDMFNTKKVNLNFPLVYYPYEKDPIFWDNMLEKDINLLVDARYLEIQIIKRVKSFNENRIDDYLGIGYDRVINVFNIEKDYVMQYYSVGIIGTILLLGLYWILWMYSAFKVIVNLEEKLTMKNMMFLLGTGMVLISAYFSGNILNASSTIIPITFVISVMVNVIKLKKNKKETYILGFKVCNLSQKEILKNVKTDMKNKKQNIIYNINPLIINNFYQNEKMVAEFNKEYYQIPDGIGIVIASKMKDEDVNKTVAGIDLFEDFCELAAKDKYKVFFYGSKEGIALQSKEVIEKKYKTHIVGTINGYVSSSVAIKEIKKAKPDMLFVALGSPKQEDFIYKYRKELKDIKLIMPVGGTFDVISGNIKRAPKIIIKFHIEWLYRMIQEPKRIINLFAIAKFLFLVIFKNNWYNKKSTKEIIND